MLLCLGPISALVFLSQYQRVPALMSLGANSRSLRSPRYIALEGVRLRLIRAIFNVARWQFVTSVFIPSNYMPLPHALRCTRTDSRVRGQVFKIPSVIFIHSGLHLPWLRNSALCRVLRAET